MINPSNPPPRPDDEDLPEPPQVRRLRLLVTALTVASIVAVLAIAGALVIRLSSLGAAPGNRAPIAAEKLALPAGEEITAIGRSGAEILLTTEDAGGAERLRVFDAETGEERSITPIERAD